MARYIDADEAMQIINNYAKAIDYDCDNCKVVIDAIKDIVSVICPTADVEEVRHGEWKRINHGTICTNCYRVFDNDFEFSNKDIRTYFKRCPECGAKMDGGSYGDRRDE